MLGSSSRNATLFASYTAFAFSLIACGTDSQIADPAQIPGPSSADAMASDAASIPSNESDAALHDASLGDAAPLDASIDDASLDAIADDAAPVDAGQVDAGPRYDEAFFEATHNSYSGGDRGPIATQLDNGVRFIELDIHDDAYATIGDYRVGHDSPGNQLATGAPNPTTTLFRDWLGIVANWSTNHPLAAPIAVALDLKSDLTDNTSFALGNLGALNQTLESLLGQKLLAARDVPAQWPTVDSLRGRIMVVLSGDEPTRRAYRLDAGATVSVAMNALGQVVEVHASSHGDLWSWTGALDATGAVRWRRHAKIGKGGAPAVAISDAGIVMEAHESGSGTLAYRVGQLGSDLEIAWQNETSLGSGTKPSVRTSNGGPSVRAIWVGSGSTGNVARDGTFDATTQTIAWTASTPQATTDPRFDVAKDARGANWISVRTGVDGLAASDTLLYSTASTPVDRIHYDQIAFVEHQSGGDALLAQEARFYAAVATDKAFITASRASHKVVRAWQFDDLTNATIPPSNFPATDTPNAAWYLAYAAQNGALQ